ncbi:hypothetical protein [Litoribrevibacter albus]|uniref:Uncharacterized protein n=1 Tax=Litoribrevibacter albus TaxID=1473156 RepID=A0AA37W6G1_9GAMM|nr:hypothetical protein [Litoribrevibacter albus]GLQ31600.1 hypothetical protein GCM10007876_20790 [Litoribrevibacter albus]
MYLIKTFDLEIQCTNLEELKAKLADLCGQSVSIQYPSDGGDIDNLFVHIMEDGTVVETYNKQRTVDLNNLHL